MPALTITRHQVEKYLGEPITIDELENQLPWIGLDLEDRGPDWMKVEYNPNRPDYSSSIGIIRALLGIMGKQKGLPRYRTSKSKMVFIVEPSVRKVRPYIVGAVIRNLKLTDENVQEVMGMQEDLHWAVGRDRRKAAIGLHDLDQVKPPFTYKGIKPKDISFIPLTCTKELNLQEIVKHHPKGQKYRHLVDDKPLYPIIVDVYNRVLSFPPIINGILTQVRPSSENFLIDITGPD